MPLGLLASQVWSQRWPALLLTLLLFGSGAAVILSWPRAYRAEAIVAPAETTGIATSSLLSTAGTSPALSALLETRPTGNFAVYLGALRSAEAAAMLAQETSILRDLVAGRQAGLAGALRRLLGFDAAPDLDDVRSWLEQRLAVTQSLGAGTWSIVLAHPGRESGLDALGRLHAFAEAKVRADLADLARRRVAALEARLMQERDQYLRQSLFELLAQQQRAGLVVAADDAVAARLVSGPSVELRPSLPNRPLLLALLAIAAPVAAAALIGLRALMRGPPPPPARLPGPESDLAGWPGVRPLDHVPVAGAGE